MPHPLEPCSLCGKLLARMPTRTTAGPVCNACYQREFRSVACTTCSKPTRSYHGLEPALCRGCRGSEGLRCVRCNKPTSRRSLDVPGGKACAYCQRFFEPARNCTLCGRESRHLSTHAGKGITTPACTSCIRADHETCSGCRKHRAVAQGSEKGRPLCRRCAQGTPFVCGVCHLQGSRHSARECRACYDRRAVLEEAQERAPLVPEGWARDAFVRFAEARAAAPFVHPRRRTWLIRQAQLFVELGQAFAAAAQATPERLLGHFGLEGLRRQREAYGWLVQQNILPAVRLEDASVDTESRAQARLLARVSSPWKLALLQRYQRHLLAYLARWRKRGWCGENERFTDRTVTLLIRAAWRFLDRLGPEHTSPQSIDRGAFETLVTEYPGHRNALHSFVSYLNRKEHLFQKLHIDHGSARHSLPYNDLLSAERAAELRRKWLACGPLETRNALLFLLMLTYVRTTKQVCAMRLRDFVAEAGGALTCRFGAVALEVEPRVAELVRRHVRAEEVRRGAPLQPDDYLFAGQLPGRSLTTSAMQYLLKNEGVTANQLYTTGLVAFFRSGLRHPKLLVQALGISDQTAVKYWEAFNPRIADEMALLGPSSP